jgi:hypothetical protein
VLPSNEFVPLAARKNIMQSVCRNIITKKPQNCSFFEEPHFSFLQIVRERKQLAKSRQEWEKAESCFDTKFILYYRTNSFSAV